MNPEMMEALQALAAEKERGSQWATVGLDIDWGATEALYDRYGKASVNGGFSKRGGDSTTRGSSRRQYL